MAKSAKDYAWEQIKAFCNECPLIIYQGPYNILQRGLDQEVIPWCQENGIAIAAYWVLMRGLLTGNLARNHSFDSRDKRSRWPICQGTQWQRLQDFLDVLRTVAKESGKTVAQIVTRSVLDCAGITAVLCGASSPDQARENAGSSDWQLDELHKQMIGRAVTRYTTAA